MMAAHFHRDVGSHTTVTVALRNRSMPNVRECVETRVLEHQNSCSQQLIARNFPAVAVKIVPAEASQVHAPKV